MLLLVTVPLQPPLPVAVNSHVAKAMFTAVWVWQAAVVISAGQMMLGGVVASTVKVVQSRSQQLATQSISEILAGLGGAVPAVW